MCGELWVADGEEAEEGAEEFGDLKGEVKVSGFSRARRRKCFSWAERTLFSFCMAERERVEGRVETFSATCRYETTLDAAAVLPASDH